MPSNTQAILCGSCKSPAKTVANPEPDDQVTCPRCGRADRFDQVMRSVSDHVAHLTQKYVAEQLSKSTRGNRFVKFKMQQSANRSFPWIVEKGF